MSKKRYKGKARLKLLRRIEALKEDGLSHRAIAAVLDETDGTIAGTWRDRDKIRDRYASVPDADSDQDASGGSELSHEPPSKSSLFTVEAQEYRGNFPTQKPPRFTGWLRLSGDFLVLNDIHIPATNWAFAERALDVARAHLPRPRKCLIAGDLINGDAVSRWPDLVVCTPLADELEFAAAYLDHLAETFDEIYMIRGNHESRLLYSMEGQLHAPQFRRMLTERRQVHFSIYPKATITSGGQCWYIVHQKNYSKNPLTVARQLAEKRHMHIIAAHQHHSALGRDRSNTYTLIDSGGLHDSDLMAYVQLEETTSPVMNNGFVLLRDGVGTLFTPASYHMVDWSLWLDDAADWAVAA